MISYVYHVYIKEELVYIGYSTNLIQRFGAHLSLAKSGTCYYNYNFYLAINDELANGRVPKIKISFAGKRIYAQYRESDEIEKYKPIYNSDYRKRTRSKKRYKRLRKPDYSNLRKLIKINIEQELSKYKSGVCR